MLSHSNETLRCRLCFYFNDCCTAHAHDWRLWLNGFWRKWCKSNYFYYWYQDNVLSKSTDIWVLRKWFDVDMQQAMSEHYHIFSNYACLFVAPCNQHMKRTKTRKLYNLLTYCSLLFDGNHTNKQNKMRVYKFASEQRKYMYRTGT